MGTSSSKVGTEVPDLPQPRDDNPWTKEVENDDEIPKLPLPVPPKMCKGDIFNSMLFENIDKHAQKVEKKHLNSTFEELAYHITKICKTDMERIRAIFSWVTSCDIAALVKGVRGSSKDGSPMDYVKKIHNRKGNLAYMFAHLCLAAGVPCVIITGINKSSAYKLGGPIERERLAAQWNAVLIDEQWRLVDCFWGSTCTSSNTSNDWTLLKDKNNQHSEQGTTNTVVDVEFQEEHNLNEFFFLTDPMMLASTHLPNDSQWQMLDSPIDIEQFEKQAYLRERFFDMDARLVGSSLHYCVNEARTGEIEINFGIPSATAAYLQFAYLIYQERGQAMPDEFPLKRYVLYEKKAETVSFSIQFPVDGRFKIDIFGKHKVQNSIMELMASYIVNANGKPDAQALPDEPEIGWGAGTELEDKGVQTEHIESVIETQTGLAELRFTKTNPLSVMQAMRHNNMDDWLLQRVSVIWEDGDDVVVSVRLPEAGQYGFKLYADDPDSEGELSNICNYLLKSINPNAHPNLFPKLYHWVLGKGRHAEELEVKAVSNPGSHVQTEDGKLRLEFEHPPEQELMLQLTGNKYDEKLLAQSITRFEEDGRTVFEIDLPDAGEYGVNVYAKDRKSKTAAIHHVHSCLVESTQTTKRVTPLEVQQEPSPVDKSEIETFRKMETVPAPPGPFEHPLVGSLQRQQAQDPLDDKGVLLGTDADAFKVKLPELGKYDLDIFEKLPSGALLAASSVTIVRRPARKGEVEETEKKQSKEKPDDEETRKRREIEAKYAAELRSLRAGVKVLDPEAIERALAAIKAKGEIPEQLEQEVTDAENLLKEFKKYRDALNQAMEKGTIEAIEKALNALERASPAVRKKLESQQRQAQDRVQRLRRIEKHRHNILKLKKTTIAEIRAYATPPEAVYSVMRATFTILGDPENITTDWKALQALIGKTGPMNLLRRVRMYEVSTMTEDTHKRCQRMMTGLDINIVRDVSVGAAAFYIWVTGMMEVALETNNFG